LKLIEVHSLTKYFGTVRALDDVNFHIEKGESFGLVGESGSGKTTLARILLRLIRQSEGEVVYSEGFSRKDYQIVFQNPWTSLNPRMKVKDILKEPLRIHRLRKDLAKTLKDVELDESYLDKYPHEMSGGQRQRIGIARALCIEPKFVVLDEPVSSLDVTVQVEILKIIKKLKVEQSLTVMLVAHDISVIRFMCDRVAVMRTGSIVEVGRVDEVFRNPQHSYTRLLLESIPRLHA